MEQSKEVKASRIEYTCDVCKEGKMVFGDIVLTSYPAQYPHYCDKCGSEITLDREYPYIKYS